jgi:hypothetical protein
MEMMTFHDGGSVARGRVDQLPVYGGRKSRELRCPLDWLIVPAHTGSRSRDKERAATLERGVATLIPDG